MGEHYTVKQIKSIHENICKLISDGKSQRDACIECGVDESTYRSWKAKNTQYAHENDEAVSDRAFLTFESIIEDFSEEPQRDPESGRIDTGWVQLQKLKIDAKKWMISKMLPKKFGNSIDLTTDGKSLPSPTIIVQNTDE